MLLKYRINLLEIMFYVMVATIPLMIYRVPFIGLNWSIDRIIIVPLLIISIPMIFSKKLANQGYLIIFFCVIAALVSSSMGSGILGKRYLPSYIQSYAVFFLTYLYICREKRSFYFVELAFCGIALILTVFSIQGIYHYYVLKARSFDPLFIQLVSTEGLLDAHKVSMLRSRRLFWPFPSAPLFGFVTGFISLYGIGIYLIKKNRYWLCVGCLMFVFCFLSLSRGALLAYICAFGAFLFLGNIKRIIPNSRRLLFFLFIGTFLIAVLAIGYKHFSSHGMDSLSRLTSFTDDASIEGHIRVRLNSLKIFISSSLMEVAFGHGLGNTQNVMDVSSVHMTFLTVLLEQGILGFFCYVVAYGYPVVALYKRLRMPGPQRPIILLGLSLAIFLVLANCVYNATSVAILWFFLGFLYSLVFSSPEEITGEKVPAEFMRRMSRRHPGIPFRPRRIRGRESA